MLEDLGEGDGGGGEDIKDARIERFNDHKWPR